VPSAPAAASAPAPAPAPALARTSPPSPADQAGLLACSEKLARLHCDTDYVLVYPDRCTWYRSELARLRTVSPDEQTRRELWCLQSYGQINGTAQIELRRYFRGRKPPVFKDELECVRKVRDLVCGPAFLAIERKSCEDWTRKAAEQARMTGKDRSAVAHMCRLDYHGLADQVAHLLRTHAAGTKAP
jgi:hypothetical protein